MSSTSISPVPSASPSVCNSQVSFDLPDNNISRPYCAFNWATPVRDLRDCCDESADILVFNNCTQYCEHTGTQKSWQDCVVAKEPAANLNVNQFPCYPVLSAKSSAVSSVIVTTSIQTASQSMTSTPSTTKSTGKPESAGVGNILLPLPTFYARVSSLLTVTAGFIL